MKTYNSDDNLYIIFVGENASENWKLLKDSKKDDLFFHLSCFSSCYVIARLKENQSNTSIKNIIYKCADICKQHTKYRNLPIVKVDWCTCENVHRTEIIGSVQYKNNKKVKQIKI